MIDIYFVQAEQFRTQPTASGWGHQGKRTLMSKPDRLSEEKQIEWRHKSRLILVLRCYGALITGVVLIGVAVLLPDNEPGAWFGRFWIFVLGGLLVILFVLTAYTDIYRARLTSEGLEVQTLLTTSLLEYSRIGTASLKSSFLPAFYQDYLVIRLESGSVVGRFRWFFFDNIFASSSRFRIEALVDELKTRIESTRVAS